jgi:hypothetical protein
MTRRASFYLAIAIALAWTGCGDDTSTDAGGDGGGARIEIGTGDIGDYTALAPGDTTLLVRGSQGGQHIWVGLRAWDLDTRPALIQLLLEDADGELLSNPFQVRLTFQDEVPAGESYAQISGLALVVLDAAEVLGQSVTIRARVSENRTGGTMAESVVRSVNVEWDPNNPPGFRPGDDGGIPDAALRGDVGVADGGVDAAPTDAAVDVPPGA